MKHIKKLIGTVTQGPNAVPSSPRIAVAHQPKAGIILQAELSPGGIMVIGNGSRAWIPMGEIFDCALAAMPELMPTTALQRVPTTAKTED